MMMTNRIMPFPEGAGMRQQQKGMGVQALAASSPGTPVGKKIREEEVMLGKDDMITTE